MENCTFQHEHIGPGMKYIEYESSHTMNLNNVSFSDITYVDPDDTESILISFDEIDVSQDGKILLRDISITSSPILFFEILGIHGTSTLTK
jgi:hypothetical protein